ncbi:MAG: FKBP-type peptidyl-prolyl cis-trans isomerase [Flavobacteriales bacterium]
MKLLKYSFVLLTFAMLSSCSDRFEGYTEIDENTYFKLFRFGEGETFSEAHYAELTATTGLYREDYVSYQVGFGLETRDLPQWTNSNVLNQRIGEVKLGDSCAFRVPFAMIRNGIFDEFSTDEIPVHDTVLMDIHFSVDRMLDSLQYNNWMSELIRKGQEEEEKTLREVLGIKNLLQDLTFENGVFFQLGEVGDGEKLKGGDEIALALTGCFLNDSIFDTAQDSASYLYFPIGKSDQVVPGIEQVLTKLHIGQSARVYCPSYKAFGRRGSSTGIVPPKTPVYFDIEVVKKFD